MPIGDGRIRNAAIDAATVGHPVAGALIKAAAEAALERAGMAPMQAADTARDIAVNPPAGVAAQAAEVVNAIDTMPGGKSVLSSLTIRALGATMLTELAHVLEITSGGVTVDEWQPLLWTIGGIVGTAVAIWGRIRAKRPIGK